MLFDAFYYHKQYTFNIKHILNQIFSFKLDAFVQYLHACLCKIFAIITCHVAYSLIRTLKNA